MRQRWNRAIKLAFSLANSSRVPTGTRYDALRMVALGDRGQALTVLAQYLKPGTDDELVMGAISGLGDIDSSDDAKVAPLLLEALPRLNAENLGMALGALARTPDRSLALLNAIATGRVEAKKVVEPWRGKLRETADPVVQEKARRLLP